MKKERVLLILLFICIAAFFAGCSSKQGLIALDTRPSQATVYLDGRRVGVTPVEFECDLRTPTTLTIEKEGFYPEREVISRQWVNNELNKGNLVRGRFPIQGRMKKAWKVITTIRLDRQEE